MPDATLPGPAGSTVSLSYASTTNEVLAQQILSGIPAAISAGSEVENIYPALEPTGSNVVEVIPTGISPDYTAPANVTLILDEGGTTIHGGLAQQQVLLAGSHNVTYYANLGSGTVIAGAGNDYIEVGQPSGNHLILTDSGNDTIRALGGNDSIRAGSGHNFIQLGIGNVSVDVTGQDTIFAGSGSDTVTVEKGGRAVLHGGSGNLLFINSGGLSTIFGTGHPGDGWFRAPQSDGQTEGYLASTVLGGTGSATIFGGVGGGEFHGGTAGDNLIVGGLADSTLYGGGTGDTLIAAGHGTNLLVAGAGNESLIGGAGNDSIRAGSGDDVVKAGQGADSIIAGDGNETVWGGQGADRFVFKYDATAGGRHAEIEDFTVGKDRVVLRGYGAQEIHRALGTATVQDGSLTLKLSDSTTITFDNIEKLQKSSFVSDGKS